MAHRVTTTTLALSQTKLIVNSPIVNFTSVLVIDVPAWYMLRSLRSSFSFVLFPLCASPFYFPNSDPSSFYVELVCIL